MGVDGSPGVVVRRAERDALRRAVARGLGGTPAVVVVVGEPGIGKSTLAAQVAAEVRADGTRVVYGSADEHDRSAYGLWREPWARVAPASALLDPALPTEEQRWEVLTRMSEALVDGPPVLLVLEDLHWADDLTLWVLARLLPRLAGQPLAAPATCRTSGAAPVLEHLRPSDVVDLVGLDANEVAELVAARLGPRSGGPVYAADDGPEATADLSSTRHSALAPPVVRQSDDRPGTRLRRLGARLARATSWTPPTSTEIGVVAKSGLAAGLSWSIAGLVTGVPGPALAPLTALVVVQVSVRASLRLALQRSAAVVLGVLLALAIGDALTLNGFTVGVLAAVSLGVTEFVLRLPASAARQVPVSVLVVLTAVTSSPITYGWQRAVDTAIGAAVGVVVSLVLPASRLVDARQTLDRLGSAVGGVLESMGAGLQQPWSTDQTAEWRGLARTARDRLVRQAVEAVGNGRDAARWNARDRRHLDVLGRYEDVMPRLERTAIGVSVISRGLDDHARLAGSTHPAMPAMGALLVALANAVRSVVQDVLSDAAGPDVGSALEEVRVRRQRCALGASRRAKLAIEHDEAFDADELEGEWLGYAALLVQVDRIVGDLSAPLPT